MTATVERTPDPTTRIERLNRASARLIDPDADLPGAVGEGQLLPDELLSIHQLPEFQDLTPEQKATLSREEIASIVDAGLRFEAVLMAGFSLELVMHGDLTDPAVVYALHEMGEETRHSRLFSRLLSQIQPQARNPLNDRLRKVQRLLVQRLIARPATFDVLVLGGEEIPDLFQKVASEHPDTDPFIREVNRYHRAEEARHLAFARTVLPDRWANASRVDRFLLRHVAPYLIADKFRMLVHPGVYRTIGLPGWSTWRRANRTPARVALRHKATRPILDTLVANGVFKPGRVPKAWRSLTGT
jgi:hypothetical protein